MEANLLIKSYRAEGNKVKDIQFYGDWELEIGGEKTQYIDVNAMSHGIAPTGIDYLDTSTATSFKFKNNTANTVYFRVIYSWAYAGQTQGTVITVASGNTISFSLTSSDERALPQIGVFSDKKCTRMVGYITFRRGDVPVEITHY
jgi:hypothetical protein